MHAHDNDNEEARQLTAAMQTLRRATELSTAAPPGQLNAASLSNRQCQPGPAQHAAAPLAAPKIDDGQPRPVPAARGQRRQPLGRILEEDDRVLRHVGKTFGPRLLAVVDDAGALYPSRQRGAKRDGQALSGELNTRWP